MNEGTEQVVQSPVNGYESETYKILKDSQGNQRTRLPRISACFGWLLW